MLTILELINRLNENMIWNISFDFWAVLAQKLEPLSREEIIITQLSRSIKLFQILSIGASAEYGDFLLLLYLTRFSS